VRNAHIGKHLPDKSASLVSRMLRRLRSHGVGVVKKVGRTYKYYVTAAGRSVMTTGIKLKTLVSSPSWRAPWPRDRSWEVGDHSPPRSPRPKSRAIDFWNTTPCDARVSSACCPLARTSPKRSPRSRACAMAQQDTYGL
jgi:hypothetical protein